MAHLEHEGLLAEEQNGFRKNRSCEQHIFSLVTLIKNNLVSKKSVYTTFVDFRKAFDVTDRQLLYYKLLKGGVYGPIFEIIRQIYQNNTSVMRLNGHLSNELSTTQGLRQGDNLSPCLFNYYINGLIETLRESNEGVRISELEKLCVLAYVDDIVIISETPEGLQNLLDILTKWCNDWWVMVNIDKTKVLHFRNPPKKSCDYLFRLNGMAINKCKEYKYLGITLNYSLSMNYVKQGLVP